jgi:glucose-6-phosphate 1-epimerase
MLEHLKLDRVKDLSKSVSIQIDSTGYQFIIIEHQLFNAAFAVHGAHLIHFQCKDQQPMIWLSKTSIYNDHKAIRGGVPICWPWFGSAGDALGENLPAHGFARTNKWTMTTINEFSEGIELEFRLTDNQNTLKIWPFNFELTLKATLTDQVKLELISKNTGNIPFTYRGALHSYLNISAPEKCLITGLNKQYSNSLNGGTTETGDSTLQIDSAIDSIYKKAPSSIALSDQGYHRELVVNNFGNDSEVLWTPWIKGAKAFIDMPDKAYETMFCIESAITNSVGVQVQPNESHSLITIISEVK